MDYLQVMDVSAAGMRVQKTRLEVAAHNLANMQTVRASNGQPYQPMRVISRSNPTGQPGSTFGSIMDGAQAPAPVRAEVVQDVESKPRLVYEPGHPHADKNGMVKYSGVDHLQQMVVITEALRAYEANLAAMHASRSMAVRALDIGSN